MLYTPKVFGHETSLDNADLVNTGLDNGGSTVYIGC